MIDKNYLMCSCGDKIELISGEEFTKFSERIYYHIGDLSGKGHKSLGLYTTHYLPQNRIIIDPMSIRNY